MKTQYDDIGFLLKDLFQDSVHDSTFTGTRAFARALSELENNTAITQKIFAHPDFSSREKKVLENPPHVIGMTGLPGSGKSTLTNLLVRFYRKQQKRVVVFAVDPSDRTHHGAILGDRLRMQEHFQDKGVFLRSFGARGALGGVSRCLGNCVRLAAVAGFDVIIIETIGVGQSEQDITDLAQTVLLTLVPDVGDDLQIMKSGIMQHANIYVINKKETQDVTKTLALLEENLTQSAEGRFPCVLATSAYDLDSVQILFQRIQDHKRQSDYRNYGAKICQKNQDSESPSLLGIDHLGIVPKKNQTAHDFFEKFLRLPYEGSEEVPDQKVETAFFQCRGISLELLKATSDDSPVAQFLEKRGSGIHHIAFRVQNIEKWMANLALRGVKFLDEKPRRGAHNSLICFIHPHSTGGILVELVERCDI